MLAYLETVPFVSNVTRVIPRNRVFFHKAPRRGLAPETPSLSVYHCSTIYCQRFHMPEFFHARYPICYTFADKILENGVLTILQYQYFGCIHLILQQHSL